MRDLDSFVVQDVLEELPVVNGLAEDPSVKVDTDTAVVTSKVLSKDQLSSAEEVIRERGLSPDDWVIERVVVNTWETTSTIAGTQVARENHQLKVFLHAKLDLVLPKPAEISTLAFLPTTPHPTTSSKLYAILSDFQIPYQDDNLVDLACDLLASNTIDGLIINGDFLNCSNVSKYKTNPEFNSELNAEFDVGVKILAKLIAAVGEHCTYRKFLMGNHEARLQDAILARLPQFYGLHRGGEEESVVSIPYLLRLQEFGFEWGKDYPQDSVVLPNTDLYVNHGNLTGDDASFKFAKQRGCSILQGHDNRSQMRSIVYPGAYNQHTKLWAISGGCMAAQDQGYNNSETSCQSFALIYVFEDGSFSPTLASYNGKSLIWQNQKYT